MKIKPTTIAKILGPAAIFSAVFFAFTGMGFWQFMGEINYSRAMTIGLLHFFSILAYIIVSIQEASR